MPVISQSKDKKTMKFGQLIEYNQRHVFLSKHHAKNEVGRLVSDFLFSEKTLYEVKPSGLQLSVDVFPQPS